VRKRIPRAVLAIVLLLVGARQAFAADDTATDRGSHSNVFPLLASTYVALNALDIYTTVTAVRSGAGVEANPLVGAAAANPVALTALKAASTTATLALVRRLWKRHPAGAITLLIAANVGMAAVVSHNARAAGGF
jgi:hypothetical protein